MTKKVCPKCGGEKFSANQVCYHDIYVDGCNDFLEDKATSDSDTPYGPYACIKCGEEFDELTELKEVEE